MMAHQPGTSGRHAWEEIMRKKYKKEYSTPKVITRFVDLSVNPAFEEAKVEGVIKPGIAVPVGRIKKKRRI